MTPKPTNNGCEPFNQKFTRRAEKERWNLPATKYEPLKASDLEPILRPGALDHEKYGSRQASGSVKPYTKPVHGCVGKLPDNNSRLTPDVIAKHKKQYQF